MANIIRDFLGYLKLGEEDEEYEDYTDEDDYEEPVQKIRRRETYAEQKEPRPVREKRTAPQVAPVRSDNEPIELAKERNRLRTERTTSNKVVPIRTTAKGMEVCIMKPTSFEDAQDISDMLLSGRAVVVNLEGFDPLDAQRIMDFVSGAVYAVNGKLHQISKYIFIFSPEGIDISGDNLGFVADDNFEVPTLNKEF